MQTATRKTCQATGLALGMGVFLALGLFGSVGWIAALVLGLAAGWMSWAMLDWLACQGAAASDGSEFAPQMPRSSGPAAPRPAAIPVRTVPQAAGRMAAADEAEDLSQIRGIGPRIVESLAAQGVTRFSQIAAWDEDEIDAIGVRAGFGAGRVRRDDWVGQARRIVAEAAHGRA